MRSFAAVLAAVLLFAACDRSPVDTLPRETSFTFEYRLGDEGWQSFAARGQQPAGTSLTLRGPYVFTGGSGPPYYGVYVAPFQQAGTGWMGLVVWLPVAVQGDTVLLGDPQAMTCPGASPRPCMEAVFFVESAPQQIVETCRTINGELVFTRRTEQWVSGRLHGTGICTSAAGAQRSFDLRNGRFDIGLPPPESARG